MYNQSVFVTGA